MKSTFYITYSPAINLYFRYSEDGEVQECRLLDLQVVRVGSPALDLNYLLYCSLTGDVRKAELENFFVQYYATFASVLAGGGVPMKFTLPQLKKEFFSKNLYGLLFSQMIIPGVIIDQEDAPEMEKFGENMQEGLEELKKKMASVILSNPLLKPRMLSVYDDMMESGCIPT